MKVGWDGIKAVIGYFVGKIQTCGKQWHFPKQQKWTLSFIYLGIYRWRNSGNSVRLYFGGSKITVDSDCSREIKRRLLLGRKVMTNLDNILKNRDITLPTKVRLVKLWFFQWSCMDVRSGLWRKLSTEELMLLKCGVGEDSWESFELQEDPTGPFWRRSALGFLWKEWC